MSSIFQTRNILPSDPHVPKEPSNAPGVGEFVNALAIDSVQASLNHSLADFFRLPDPEFHLTDKNLEAYTNGIDPVYWPQFGTAQSHEHALEIRRRMSEQQYADRALQASGRWAIAGKIGASFVDPPQLMAMLATGGAGSAFGAAGIAVKGERLAAAVRAGFVGAGINAGTTAFESTQKPTIAANDVMRSSLMGLGMGAAGPALAGTSRATRFLGGGAMSATPTLVYDLAGRVTGLSDVDARDMQAEAIQNFVIGGAFSALHSTHEVRTVATEADRAVAVRQAEVLARDKAATELYEKVARSYYKDLQFRDIAEAARDQGKTPQEVVTPKGESAFSEQLAALQHNREVTDALYVLQQERLTPDEVVAEASRRQDQPSPQQFVKGLSLTAAEAKAAASFADLAPDHLVFESSKPHAAKPQGFRHVKGSGFIVRLAKDGVFEFSDDFAKQTPARRRAAVERIVAGLEARKEVAAIDFSSAGGEARIGAYANAAVNLRERLGIPHDDAAALVKVAIADAAKKYRSETGRSLFEPSPTRDALLRAVMDSDAPMIAPSKAAIESLDTLAFRRDRGQGSPTDVQPLDGSPGSAVPLAEAGSLDAGVARTPAQAKPAAAPASEPPRNDAPGLAMGAASENDPAFLAFRQAVDNRTGKTTGDLFIDDPSDALPTFGKFARLGISNAGFAPDGDSMSAIRRSYNAVFYDPISKKDGSMGGEAATWSYGERRSAHAQAERSERSAYAKHIEHRRGMGEKQDTVLEFNRKVTEYRRSEGKLWADDPGVKAHSDHLNQMYAKELARQQRHGVVNAENVKDNKWHTPRVWVPKLVDQVRSRAVRAGPGSLVEGIAARVMGDVPEAHRRVMAEAVLRRQMDKFHGTDVARGNILEGDAIALMHTIAEIDPTLTQAEIREMVYYQKPDAPEGTPQWLRKRIALDETTPMELVDQYTGEKFSVPISEMLNNDATELARRYVDHSVGTSTLAELFHTTARRDEKVPVTIQDYLDNLRVRMAADGVSEAEYLPHLERIEHGLKRLGGQPVRKYTDADHWLRAITNLQFFRTMSSIVTGIQNYQQVAGAMAQGGWEVAIKSVPEILNIRAMMKRTDGLHLDNESLREIEAIGHGDSPMAHRPRMFAPDENMGEVSKARKAAYYTARAAQVTGRYSLQEWSSKHAAYSAGIVYKNTWASMVGGNRPLGTGKNGARLSNIGMKPEMAERVAAMIRKHAVTEKTASGVKIKAFETSAWVEDPQAASAFNVSQGRFIERVTGEGNETDLPLWMSHSVANVMLQLRKFVAKQWSGQTLHSVDQAYTHGRYAGVACQLVTTSAWSALLYMARVYVQSVGRPDRQQYLDTMLEDDKIWKAGIGRNDSASLLPWFTDLAMLGTGAPEPVFNFARASEMREAGGRFQSVFGNPTTSWLEGVYGTTGAAGGSLFYDDYTFSKEDLESVSRGLAIPNLFNTSTIIKKLLAEEYDLPAYSRMQQRGAP